MSTVTIDSEGQLTLPVAIRQKLGIVQGGKLEVIELGEGLCGFVAATEDIRSLKGIVHKPRRPVTLEAMEQAIRQRAI